jgi:uncharacterized protein
MGILSKKRNKSELVMGLFTTNSSEDENAPDIFHFPTSSKLLLIFTKNPELGKCKTRLARSIGDEAALKIYEFLLNHTVEVTQPLGMNKRVYYSDEIWENDIWDSKYYSKKVQRGNDLGQRMQEAFQQGFNDGYQKVVIIGSDLYDLETHDIEAAFQALDGHDVVIGPAHDGGYYLLGMKQMKTQLFKDKNWGTPSVLKDTLANLQTERYVLLDIRNDVDVYEDIVHLDAFQPFLNSKKNE